MAIIRLHCVKIC